MPLSEVAILISFAGAILAVLEKTFAGYKKIIQIEFRVDDLKSSINRLEQQISDLNENN